MYNSIIKYCTILMLCVTSVFSQSIKENFTGGNQTTYDITASGSELVIAVAKSSFDLRPVQLYKFSNNKFQLMTVLTEGNDDLYIESGQPRLQTNQNGDLFVSLKQEVYQIKDNQWVQFKSLSESEESRINSFLIDTENNHWAALSDQKGHTFMMSYLTKFDKSTLSIVDTSNYPKYRDELYPTHDGMVITNCSIFGDDTLNGRDDIYFLKNGEIVNTIKLQSANGKHEYKYMNQIYTDKEDNIWFCYKGKKYTDPNYDNTLSGLSALKENGEWMHFTNQDNYPMRYEEYLPALGIVSYKDGWLVLFEDELMYINENYEIDDFDMVDFFDQTSFYKTTEAPNDILIQFLNRLKNKEEGSKPSLIKIVTDSDGRVFITSNMGIFVHNNGISSIEESEVNDVVVYPNPVKSSDEYLNVESINNMVESAEIVDVSGKTVVITNWETSGNNTKFRIPEGLSAGTHYLIITTPNGRKEIKFSFIK